MKKDEIKVGGLYTARVSGNFVTVRVDAIKESTSRAYASGTHYDVTNLATGRKTTFRSAAKFRCEAKPQFEKCQGGCGKVYVGANKPWTCLDCVKGRNIAIKTTTTETITPVKAAALLALPGEGIEEAMERVEKDTARAKFNARVQENIETAPQVIDTPDDEDEDGDEDENPDPNPAVNAAIKRGDYAEADRLCRSDDLGKTLGRALRDADEEDEQRSDPTATSVTTKPITAGSAVGVTTNPVGSLGFAARIASMTAPTGITLTDEQRDALDAAKVIEDQRNNGQRVLVLKAGAGSGKTFELQQMEKILTGILQYTAYNKPLVTDSTPKFKRANCATTHKLAFAATGRKYQHRLNGKRMRSYEVAARLGISDYTIELPASISPPDKDGKPVMRHLKAKWLAGQVTESIRRFCQSADPALTTRHLAFIGGIDEKDSRANNDRVKGYLLPFAKAMWVDITDPNGSLPFSHDCYVKLWDLGTGKDRPVIAADCIMLDEYQDTAPVMVSILKKQTHAMLVLVGDDNQRIYEWRGAINAGDEFPNAERRLLSKSFRFGQAVADVANSVLAELESPTDLIMTGLETIPSRICPVAQPRCYLYRTNAGAIGRLMSAQDEGKRGHLIGGSKEVVAFCEAALELQQGRTTEHQELGCFTNWAEVQTYSKEDEGADLRLMVKLIDEFGADRIISALTNMPAEKDADLIISTAHRSKGREWPSVKLGQDFRVANKLDDSERRLVYVAATRAQEELDITECPTFCGGWDKQGGGEDGSGGEARWIPGIDITYSAPMPTAADLAAYRAGKSAPSIATRAVSAPTPAPAPMVASPARTAPPAPANGSAEFSWANMDNVWCIRGPKDCKPGSTVTVTRKNGQRSQVTLRGVTRKLGDLWFYAI